MIALLCLSLIVPLAGGYLLARSIVPAQKPASADKLLKAGLAIGLGFGLTSCLYFLGLLFIGSSKNTLILIEAVFCFILVFLLKSKKTEEYPSYAEIYEKPQVQSLYERILSIAFYVALASTFTTVVLIAIRLPNGAWDAWAIWNLRARFIFRGGEHWTNVFSSLLSPSTHPDYPFLVSATIARIWKYLGEETQFVPAILGILFTFATAGIIYSAVAIMRSKSQGCLAGLFLLSNVDFIYLGTCQYADVPLGFFFLTSLVLVSFQDIFSKKYGLSFLAGVMAGFAGWTKNEGLLFLGSLFMARLLVTYFSSDRRTYMKQLLYFTLGSLPVLAIILYFKMNLAPPSDLVQGQGLTQTIDKLWQLSRYVEIIKAFGNVTVSVFPQLILLLIYPLFLGIKITARDRIKVATLVLVMFFMIFGYFMVYVITPYDLSWHLSSSLPRLLLQLWPSFLFIYFILISTPEEALLAGQNRLDPEHRMKGRQVC
jgi:hypothetical protein